MNFKYIKNFIIFLILIFISVYSLQRIEDKYLESKKIINIGTNVWPGYEFLYLARELNLLPQKVRLIEYNNTSEVMRAFRNRTIQGAALTLDEAFFLMDKEYFVVLTLIFDFSYGADVVMARSSVNEAILKNMRIGVEKSALGRYMLFRFLKTYNLSEDDLIIKNIEFNEHSKSFFNNEVDLIITFPPQKNYILDKSKGTKILFSSKDIYPEILDGLFFEKEFLYSHKEIIREIINAYFIAYEFFQNHPQEAQTIINRRLKLPSQDFQQIYKEIYIPDREENKIYLLNQNIEPVINRVCNFLKEGSLVHNKDLLCNQLIDTKILKEIL